jgi:hypothetical protein
MTINTKFPQSLEMAFIAAPFAIEENTGNYTSNTQGQERTGQ